MATFTWEVYAGTPAWKGISTNKIVFSGSPTNLATPLAVGAWNSGVHLGDASPGADQCGVSHIPNVEYVSNTQFKLNGGVTEVLNNANLAATECTMRLRFTDASAVAISNARFYAFNGVSETVEAVGIEAYAVEGQVGSSSWSQINDDSASLGGDNQNERLELSDRGSNTEHIFYIAVSARAESAGPKTEFEIGLALTYS